MLDWLFVWGEGGLLGRMPWWTYLAVALVLTHITIASVTIFLHRHQAHRALKLHPIVSHFFRLWLWLTTGMVTKEWVAIHRKHHAKVETAEDPHSPQTRGIRTVFWKGTELYRAEAKKEETLIRYGHGTPDDWLERRLYTRYSWQGVGLMLAIDLLLFGPLGASLWALQMLWIPVMAAGVINGVGHFWGYRNFEPRDASRNIVWWGIVIGGEELHNNHHAYETSAKLSARWFEFDIGWMYISLLQALKLAEVKFAIPRLVLLPEKQECDDETVKAVTALRYEVLARWDRMARKLEKRLHNRRHDLAALRHDLKQLWEDVKLNRAETVEHLQTWRKKALASGIPQIERFALQLSRYSLKRRQRA